jgi:rod shape-determining protein MreC
MKRLSRTGPTASKRGVRSYALIALVLGFLGFMVAQGAPQVSGLFEPVRTAASDRLAGGEERGMLSKLVGRGAKSARIRELEGEVRELSRYKAAAISMAERLEAYENILNLMGEPPARGITARVSAENDGPFAQTLLANAGQIQGVEPGSVAINEGGLVGRVILLGERSSRILLVTDFNSRIPVMGEVSGVRAILYGGRDSVGSITDMPENDSFIEGERILTSAEGGAFPRGLVVGKAMSEGRNWRVQFGMAKRDGGYIQLIPPPSIPKPVEYIEPEEPPVTASPAQGVRQ